MSGDDSIPSENIGIIFVHGIGEQRRFEHLDEQLRDLLRTLRQMTAPNGNIDSVSVDIDGTGAASFHAQQDTWSAGPGPAVTVVISYRIRGVLRQSRFQVHEVWWADVNEPYSIAKQFRFWLWALSIWWHPGKPRSNLGSASRVSVPVVNRSILWDRLRLFFLSTFFALLGFSIGILLFLVTRLFDWQVPDFLQVLANYVSSIKLYNQRRRFGPGLIGAKEEFLDAIDEPPRVSIRRRMIRAIADVATYTNSDVPNGYERWYVLAHSQGSVVAFNGLMETAYAWPGYLDESRWDQLKKAGLAGPGRAGMKIPDQAIMPRRPGWAQSNEIVYRSRVFARFRGLLTYGCPIEKFAGLWPALVPIARETLFRPGIPWINLYDPMDPISGRMRSFTAQPSECCPKPLDVGYCASWWLLLAHIKYLAQRIHAPQDAATAVVRWLLTDDATHFNDLGQLYPGCRPGRWFTQSSATPGVRSALAWIMWLLAAAVLAGAAAIVFPALLHYAAAALNSIVQEVAKLTVGPSFTWHLVSPAWLDGVAGLNFGRRTAFLFAVAAAVVLVAGSLGRLGLFGEDADDVRNKKEAPTEPPPPAGDPAFPIGTDEPPAEERRS